MVVGHLHHVRTYVEGTCYLEDDARQVRRAMEVLSE